MDVVAIGPFGGEGGGPWDDSPRTTVRQVVIHSGDFIDAIQVEYDDHGVSKWGDRHGGYGGPTTTPVVLDYPAEYFISISGYYSTKGVGDNIVIQSLTLQSNLRSYGPYGTERGVYFTFPPIIGKIVRFFGRCGTYLDGIGAYIEPFRNVKTVGPFGSPKGSSWNDGIQTGVKELIIACGSVIESITIKYNDGAHPLSVKHGDSAYGTKYTVTLDYPNEYLTSMSGYITQTSDLCSLTFQSNEKLYGPYGKEEGTHFSTTSDVNVGKIIGFFGRAGNYLNSIGAYVEL